MSDGKLIEIHNALFDFELRGNKKVVGLQVSALVSLGVLSFFMGENSSIKSLLVFCLVIDLVCLVLYLVIKTRTPKDLPKDTVDEKPTPIEKGEVKAEVKHTKGKTPTVKTVDKSVEIKNKLDLPDIAEGFAALEKTTPKPVATTDTEPEIEAQVPVMTFTPVLTDTAPTAPISASDLGDFLDDDDIGDDDVLDFF